jgi:hypothetical protein
MESSSEPKSKKSKVSASVVSVPPKLMKIVQEAAGGCDKDLEHVSGDVTAAIVVIQSKALRCLDSYLNCVCMRMRN